MRDQFAELRAEALAYGFALELEVNPDGIPLPKQVPAPDGASLPKQAQEILYEILTKHFVSDVMIDRSL